MQKSSFKGRGRVGAGLSLARTGRGFVLYVLEYAVVEVLVGICNPVAMALAAAGALLAALLPLLACPKTNLLDSWLPHVHKHCKFTPNL